LSEHGFDIGDLLIGLKACIGRGDDLDGHFFELCLEPFDLGLGPVVAGIVHDDRGLGMHGLDLGKFILAESDGRRRLRFLAIGTKAHDGLADVIDGCRRVESLGGS